MDRRQHIRSWTLALFAATAWSGLASAEDCSAFQGFEICGYRYLETIASCFEHVSDSDQRQWIVPLAGADDRQQLAAVFDADKQLIGVVDRNEIVIGGLDRLPGDAARSALLDALAELSGPRSGPHLRTTSKDALVLRVDPKAPFWEQKSINIEETGAIGAWTEIINHLERGLEEGGVRIQQQEPSPPLFDLWFAAEDFAPTRLGFKLDIEPVVFLTDIGQPPANAGPSTALPDWEKRRVRASGPDAEGDRIRVAILDTGVKHLAEDGIDCRLEPGEQTCPSACCRTDYNDRDGHGTRVASVVAHPEFGIAPNVTDIVAVRVLNKKGCGPENAIARGLRWVKQDPTIRIAVLALEFRRSSTTIFRELSSIWREDLLVIIAAGNRTIHDPGKPEWGRAAVPARLFDHLQDKSQVLVVGGTKPNDEWAYRWDSRVIELAGPAQGLPVLTRSGVREKRSGTSLTAGLVAGIAARILAQDESLTAAQLKQRLIEYADCRGHFATACYGEPCCDDCGIVDLACALQPESEACPRNTCSAPESPLGTGP